MSSRARAAALVLILSILLAGCGDVEPTVVPLVPSTTPLVPTATPNPPAASLATSPTSPVDLYPEALAYLEEALDIMQEHSINQGQIDWERLRARARSRALGARSPEDTHNAIRLALRDLGDRHSHFMTPEQVAELEDGTMNLTSPDPSGRLLDEGLGYIMIPGFVGLGDAVNEHATQIQEIIREIDAERPCGWVVDLRQNIGGNMWPMLAGLGPILGEGQVGAFVSPDGEQVGWTYTDGQAWEGDSLQAAVTGVAYELGEPLPPVAVLIGRRTSSSGEAIVVAFRGRPNTRSFGRVTTGLSTSNENFALSDGAWIFLTVSEFADRTGQRHGGVIAPDQVIWAEEAEDALTLQAAVDWLLEQPACANEAESRARPKAKAASIQIQCLCHGYAPMWFNGPGMDGKGVKICPTTSEPSL
jgi:carboxyl-terminal processing protease